MNWLLLVAIAIIGVGAFFGWRAGFVKAVFSLVSTIAVIILTLLLSPIVTGFLQSNETITGAINGKLDDIINLEFMVDDVEDQNDPAGFIDGLSLPESIKKVLKEAVEKLLVEKQDEAGAFVGDQLEALEEYICEVLTNMIINAVGFVVTFVIVAVGMAILCFVLDALSKLPVIHQLNTLAGIAFGALEGLIVLWILFVILTMFGSTEFGQACLTMISESKILSFLYDNNFISKIVIGKL